MTATIKSLDLNLLRIFDAVMKERNVLRAGERVCLSQSAVSHSLARLRGLLDDELFVRTPAGMQPTTRALAMAPRVRTALESLEQAIRLPKFDPSISKKRLTIAANDFATMVVVPRLLQLIRSEAPFVDIVIKPATPIDLAEQIDLGKINAAIGSFSAIPSRLKSNFLFEYDDVLLTHSALTVGTITTDVLSKLSIVVISTESRQEGAIGGSLSERGLVRLSEMYDRLAFKRAFSAENDLPRIPISLPHFLALPALLHDAELVAIVPRPLAYSFAKIWPLCIHEPPYVAANTEVRSLWLERNDGEPSQDWLRSVIERAAEHLRIGEIK
jgi:DNA-binding transcriptional LysR family regulator